MLYFLAQANKADSLLSGEAMGSGRSLSPIVFVLVLLLCVLAIVFIYLRRNGLQRIRKAGELDIPDATLGRPSVLVGGARWTRKIFAGCLPRTYRLSVSAEFRVRFVSAGFL